jgi:hypothetical protein
MPKIVLNCFYRTFQKTFVQQGLQKKHKFLLKFLYLYF